MGIKAKFNIGNVIRQATNETVFAVNQVVFSNLSFVGEEAVRIAREQGSYTDQTGNLRASVGYVIAYNGKIVSELGFDPSAAKTTKKARDGATGAKEGNALAYEIASQYKKGYVLVVVAGMNYAAAVEGGPYERNGKIIDKKPYDVITFTAANARILADELMSKAFGTAWAG